MMSIIKFETYKKNGTIEYIEEEKIIEKNDSFSGLDNIAQVMEMSTDELLGELSIRVDNSKGIRDVETEYLVDELTQRLLAIEYVLFLTMAKNTKK